MHKDCFVRILTILSAGVLVPAVDSLVLKVVRGLCPEFGGSDYPAFVSTSRRLLANSDQDLYTANYLRQYFEAIYEAIDGGNLAPGSRALGEDPGPSFHGLTDAGDRHDMPNALDHPPNRSP